MSRLVDWTYCIKEVWGLSETHDEFLHFKQRTDAEKLAHGGLHVLLYETGYKADGSHCLFAQGHITGRQFLRRDHYADGVLFGYCVPYRSVYEFPSDSRTQGVHKDEVEQILGRVLSWQQPGGLIRLDRLEFEKLSGEVHRRYEALVGRPA